MTQFKKLFCILENENSYFGLSLLEAYFCPTRIESRYFMQRSISQCTNASYFLLNGSFTASFSRLFYVQEKIKMYFIIIAEGWMRTKVLWCW